MMYIIGYGKLLELFTDVLNSHSCYNDISFSYITINEAIDKCEKMMIKQDDIILCGERGIEVLEKMGISTMIIPIKVSELDFLKAIKRARDLEPNNEVIIISYNHSYRFLPEIQKLINIPVKELIFHNELELENLIKNLKNIGRKVIIGASWACQVAKKHNITGQFFFTESAVLNALDLALNILDIREKEMKRIEISRAITEYAYCGILSVDKHGNVILINKLGKEILDITKYGVKGNPLDELVNDEKLFSVFLSKQKQIDKLCSLHDKKIVINSIPIYVNNEFQGTVNTFTDINRVQRTEHKIRLNIHKNNMSKANLHFDDIIGMSEIMKNTIEKAKSYAQSQATILLLGETGVGKELFAQSIHNYSPFSKGPFVATNCAALPENLLASELFGYEEGAFTGAKKGGKQGLFELAHNGSIFLDEIGELPPSIQTKLLRALQEKEIMHIGGEVVIPINCRVIAATNRDLKKAIITGSFRKDLYFRISTLLLNIPSLDQRKEDVPLLTEYFILKYDPIIYNKFKTSIEDITNLLSQVSWIGNIRELENVIQRFLIISKYKFSNNKITKNELSDLLYEAVQTDDLSPLLKQYSNNEEKLIKSALQNIEKNHIVNLLERYKGNKTATAKALGISRVTLYRKLNL
jgi:transcriptional regulator, propionate catabolism operon regulatory protein